jgi:pyridoxine 4-dehydrogenase
MGMSDGPADEDESIATIHAPLDAGVIVIDSGDFYGAGRNELLIAKALKDHDRDAVTLSVNGARSPKPRYQGWSTGWSSTECGHRGAPGQPHPSAGG